MLEEIKNIKSGRKELRQFGITVGAVLGLLGGLFFWRKHAYYFYFFVTSATFFSLALTMPGLLKAIQKIWMTLAIIISWIITRIILIILFYLVVTPIGIVARIFGSKFLEKGFDRNADSYWIAVKPVKIDKCRYENQF